MASKKSQWRYMNYGSAQFGVNFVEILIRLHLLFFYTDRVGLNPGWAGIAVTFGVLWDALTDPLVGQWSDHLTQKGKKRTSFLIWGTLLLCIGIISLFTVPPVSTASAKFTYLLGTYLLTNTALTLLSVPFAAMGAEVAEKKDHLRLTYAWRLAFGNLGIMVASIIMVYAFSETGFGYTGVALSCALVVALSALPSIRVSQKSSLPKPNTLKKGVNFWSFFKVVWQNKEFLKIFAAYFLVTVGQAANATLALYYYKYRLNLSESITNGIIGLFIVMFTLSILLWVKLAHKANKATLLAWSVLLLGVFTLAVYPHLPANSLVGPILMCVLGGLLVGSVLLFDLLIVELADKQASKKQERPLGLYFGVMKMGEKGSRALAIALVGFALDWIGLTGQQAPTDHQAQVIGELFGYGVGAFFVIGASAILFANPQRPSTYDNRVLPEGNNA